MVWEKIVVLGLLVVLGGCGGGQAVRSVSSWDRADQAIAQKDWLGAYEAIEVYLGSEHADLRNRAQDIARAHPEIVEAARPLFSPASLSEVLQLPSEHSIQRLEQRLNYFAAVASPSDLAIATANLAAAAANARAKIEAAEAAARVPLEQKLADADRARAAAYVVCKGKDPCDRAYALTQVFISEKADMKIQVATDTIIETYNPLDPGKIGMKAVRIPAAGGAWEIRLAITCRDGGIKPAKELCAILEADLYKQFPRYARGGHE